MQWVGVVKRFRYAAHARTSWAAFPLSCAPQVRILGKDFRIGKAPARVSGRIAICANVAAARMRGTKDRFQSRLYVVPISTRLPAAIPFSLSVKRRHNNHADCMAM